LNENAKNYIIVIALCIIVGLSGYLLGGYIHSNGTGNDAIGANYQRVQTDLRNLDTKLDGISKTVIESAGRIESSAARIERSQNDIGEVEQRIGADKARLEASKRGLDEAQSILQRSRERAKQ